MSKNKKYEEDASDIDVILSRVVLTSLGLSA